MVTFPCYRIPRIIMIFIMSIIIIMSISISFHRNIIAKLQFIHMLWEISVCMSLCQLCSLVLFFFLHWTPLLYLVMNFSFQTLDTKYPHNICVLFVSTYSLSLSFRSLFAILFQTVSVTVSVLTLTFISIDRWYAICFPLRYVSTNSRAWCSIAIIWTAALLSGEYNKK